MSLLFLALMMVQAPAAQPPVNNAPVKKAKAPQVCEYIEITGSRAKRRVCRDASGNLDLGPGVSSSLAGKGTSVSTTNGTVSASSVPPL
jgi:hypothetical protein